MSNGNSLAQTARDVVTLDVVTAKPKQPDHSSVPPPTIRLPERQRELDFMTQQGFERVHREQDLERYGPLDKKAERTLILHGPADEYDTLQKKQSELARKFVEQGLAPSEARELKMVRWKIDRIEDAKYGPHLDALERLAAMQSSLSVNLDRYVKRVGPRKRRAKRK